jgi:cardiolipin synthase
MAAPRLVSFDPIFNPALRPFDAWILKHSRIFRHAPNAITVSSGLLAPPLAYLVWYELTHYSSWQSVALCLAGVILVFAADALDGTIANRYEFRSEFGRYADPIADKVRIWSMVIALVASAYTLTAPWLAGMAVYLVPLGVLDIIVVSVTAIELLKHRNPYSDAFGKCKMTMQSVLLALMLAGLWAVAAGDHQSGFMMLQYCTVLAIVTIVVALISLWRHVRNLRQPLAD